MNARSGSDRASLLLRRAIAARELGPGDRLGTEAQLADELGATRPAVREAVRLLAQANILRATRGPGGGVFVAHSPDRALARTISDALAAMLDTSATSVAELTEVRLLLEVPLAGLTARRAAASDLAALRGALDEAERAPDDDAVQRRCDIRFHRTIAEAAGNPVAAALVAWTSEVLQPRLKDLIAAVIVEAVAREQHRAIATAIADRDGGAAERAMRLHLQYVGDVLETASPPAPAAAAPATAAATPAAPAIAAASPRAPAATAATTVTGATETVSAAAHPRLAGP
jgi:GntR family transcriptional repressor for pyruvate dehydrogenase complex